VGADTVPTQLVTNHSPLLQADHDMSKARQVPNSQEQLAFHAASAETGR